MMGVSGFKSRAVAAGHVLCAKLTVRESFMSMNVSFPDADTLPPSLELAFFRMLMMLPAAAERSACLL